MKSRAIFQTPTTLALAAIYTCLLVARAAASDTTETITQDLQRAKDKIAELQEEISNIQVLFNQLLKIPKNASKDVQRTYDKYFATLIPHYDGVVEQHKQLTVHLQTLDKLYKQPKTGGEATNPTLDSPPLSKTLFTNTFSVTSSEGYEADAKSLYDEIMQYIKQTNPEITGTMWPLFVVLEKLGPIRARLSTEQASPSHTHISSTVDASDPSVVSGDLLDEETNNSSPQDITSVLNTIRTLETTLHDTAQAFMRNERDMEYLAKQSLQQDLAERTKDGLTHGDVIQAKSDAATGTLQADKQLPYNELKRNSIEAQGKIRALSSRIGKLREQARNIYEKNPTTRVLTRDSIPHVGASLEENKSRYKMRPHNSIWINYATVEEVNAHFEVLQHIDLPEGLRDAAGLNRDAFDTGLQRLIPSQIVEGIYTSDPKSVVSDNTTLIAWQQGLFFKITFYQDEAVSYEAFGVMDDDMLNTLLNINAQHAPDCSWQASSSCSCSYWKETPRDSGADALYGSPVREFVANNGSVNDFNIFIPDATASYKEDRTRWPYAGKSLTIYKPTVARKQAEEVLKQYQ